MFEQKSSNETINLDQKNLQKNLGITNSKNKIDQTIELTDTEEKI